MGTIVMIKADAADGFDSVRRAGYAWPRDGMRVELVDDEGDTAATADAPMKVGTKTLAILKADPRILINAAESLGEVTAMKSDLESTKAELTSTKAELESTKAELRVAVEKVAELTARLESKPAKK